MLHPTIEQQQWIQCALVFAGTEPLVEAVIKFYITVNRRLSV
jgi:hypothetical protein